MEADAAIQGLAGLGLNGAPRGERAYDYLTAVFSLDVYLGYPTWFRTRFFAVYTKCSCSASP